VNNRNTVNPGIFVTTEQLKKYTKSSSKKTVKKFLSTLGPLSVGSDTVKMLRKYLETDDNGNSIEFVNSDATVDKKVRGLVHQIMCLPEFQVN
jgi:DNA topoisomerase VI subunit B